MSFTYGIIILLLGFCVGSFLNVLIFRIDDLKSVIATRSHCPQCKKTIKWYDLVPLFSFILLGGKCRACKASISWQYPAVELSTGIIFLVLYSLFGLNWSLLFYCVIFAIFSVIFVYDLKKQEIPELFSWLVLILIVLAGWYFGNFSFVDLLLGGAIVGGFLALLVVVSKERWMGSGDIKIGFSVGALVGYPRALIVLFTSFILGSIIGLIMLLFKKKGIKDTLPFAPFLIVAALITIIWGKTIMDWYLGYFYL